jgi:hypothetical protein
MSTLNHLTWSAVAARAAPSNLPAVRASCPGRRKSRSYRSARGPPRLTANRRIAFHWGILDRDALVDTQAELAGPGAAPLPAYWVVDLAERPSRLGQHPQYAGARIVDVDAGDDLQTLELLRGDREGSDVSGKQPAISPARRRPGKDLGGKALSTGLDGCQLHHRRTSVMSVVPSLSARRSSSPSCRRRYNGTSSPRPRSGRKCSR